MIGKRILSALAGIMVPLLLLLAFYYFPAGENAENAYLDHPNMIFGTGVFLGGLLSGVLQPSSRHPALNALLYSPGLWVALWLSYAAFVEGEIVSPADRNLLTVAVYPIALGWFGCRLGLAFGRRRGRGHRSRAGGNRDSENHKSQAPLRLRSGQANHK